MKLRNVWTIIKGGLKGFSLGGGAMGVGITIAMYLIVIPWPISVTLVVVAGLIFAVEGMVRTYRKVRAQEAREHAGYQPVPREDMEIVSKVKNLERDVNHLKRGLADKGIALSESESDSSVNKRAANTGQHERGQLLGSGTLFHNNKTAMHMRSQSDSRIQYSGYRNDADFSQRQRRSNVVLIR